MSTYPPLFYQLSALLSYIIPLSSAIYFITFIFWIVLSLFSAKFTIEYLDLDEKYFYLTYIFIFSSVGILKTLFVYSQITTIAGLAFGFMSLYYFWHLLNDDNSRKDNLIMFTFSLSLTAFTHHFSFLMITPMLVIFSVLNYRKVFTDQNLKKMGISLSFVFFIVFLGLLPMISSLFVIDSPVPEEEILHGSRKAMFEENGTERNKWLYSTYGLSFIMLASPGLIFFVKKNHKRRFFKLYAIAIFFFLLGLGGITRLPKLIYPGIEHWLTYERFSLLSSVFLTSILGIITLGFLDKISTLRMKRVLIISIVVGFLVVNILWLRFSEELYYGEIDGEESKEAKNFILNYLEENASSDYRYQTFGYDPTSSEIYSKTDVPTLDTTYYSGRRIDWLRESGEGEINYFSEDMFEVFMKKADNYSVRHIITLRPQYHEPMEEYNWELVRNESLANSGVKFWENPRELEKVDYSEDKGLANYFWGIIPPITAFAFLSLLIKQKLVKGWV